MSLTNIQPLIRHSSSAFFLSNLSIFPHLSNILYGVPFEPFTSFIDDDYNYDSTSVMETISFHLTDENVPRELASSKYRNYWRRADKLATTDSNVRSSADSEILTTQDGGSLAGVVEGGVSPRIAIITHASSGQLG
ncbi:hypothetical protein HNY73_007790 [Argiope bruennichi]|uniref:Uncharacterized protein n=1 Tax=Argiope bruennichi TaxID=94029 RepID=A0A8T0FFS1_ARGBR|nr:hypothetical protein HNY73_007790 [Argiope bruennichi]